MTATTARTAMDRPDPYIGPCPPWCDQVETGHQLEFTADDRRHVGASVSIELPLVDMILGPPEPPDPRPARPATIDVQLERRDADAEPRIALTINDQSDLELRLDDARALRDALTDRLDAAAAPEVTR